MTQHRASLGELVRTLPVRQLLLLWSAIFSTFATIGFLLDILAGGRFPLEWQVWNVMLSGGLAVGFSVTSLRRQWLGLAALIAADVVCVVVTRRLFHLEPVAPPGRIVWDVLWTLVALSVGYSLFIQFMNVTATRYLRAQAELAVAREIHQVLVPSIDHAAGEYEFFGWSIASGEVGGDLVGLVHADGSVAAVLGDIQTALMPLKQPNMYVTVACVRGGAGSDVECAVAGHHPVLRVRAGAVEEVTTPQLAVGMFEDAAFTSARVECRSGDLLALLTDGLIEVFDARNRELGFEWAKTALAAVADRPLREIADHLLTGARKHGAQLDDQSLLLIRRGTLAARA